MRYLLMNKDIPLRCFSCRRDEFGETFCETAELYAAPQPFGCADLTDWLRRRQAPKHRKHLEELLIRYGCEHLEGFLQVTHALSLNDTFWVKEESSSLAWNEVSLYRNDFDELVSLAAFDGQFSGTTLSSTSPEFGTDGLFAKCWVREPAGIFLYKGGSATFEIEPVSEFLAAQPAEALRLTHVAYDLAFYHDKLISKCALFTDEKHGLVKAYDVLPSGDRSLGSMLRYFTRIGSEDMFRRMCVLDALILNTDRHLGNFGVLVDNDSMDILRMAPVFDNNRSLLFDMDSSQLRLIDWCVGTCTPRIGADFVLTARGMLTPAIRADLTALTDFTFADHPQIHIPADRLDALSAIVRHQARRILA